MIIALAMRSSGRDGLASGFRRRLDHLLELTPRRIKALDLPLSDSPARYFWLSSRLTQASNRHRATIFDRLFAFLVIPSAFFLPTTRGVTSYLMPCQDTS